MPQSILLSLGLYSGFSLLGIVTVLLLPIETKGRALQVRKIACQYSAHLLRFSFRKQSTTVSYRETNIVRVPQGVSGNKRSNDSWKQGSKRKMKLGTRVQKLCF